MRALPKPQTFYPGDDGQDYYNREDCVLANVKHAYAVGRLSIDELEAHVVEVMLHGHSTEFHAPFALEHVWR